MKIVKNAHAESPCVAIQMDPFETLKPVYDTTLMLAFEAQQRGFSLFSYLPSKLTYDSKEISAYGCFFTLDDKGIILQKSQPQHLRLDTVQYVLIRQNPPYDMGYLTALDILSNLPKTTRVLNDPKALRMWGEKSIPLLFKEICPRTCITSDKEVIYSFLKQEKDIVIKPLYGFSGQDVFFLSNQVPNTETIIDIMLSKYPFGLIAQTFLKNVATNDRRLIFINGELKTVFKLVPKEDSIRSNTAAGGSHVPCERTVADQVIAERIGPFLKENDILLSGVDAIDDKLLEVNITSPAGLRISEKLYGLNLAKDFWDAASTK
jgi:glutathione synthase